MNFSGKHGFIGLAGLLLGAAALHGGIADARGYTPAFTLDEEAREKVNTSPFALMLGELRVSAADLLWIKTERYMHKGIGFAPHLDERAMASTGEAAAQRGDEHGEHEEAPLTPDAAHDYRGFVGALQRAVQPWGEGEEFHEHAGSAELIPWYRVLTLSNPHHLRGYATGAWWLMKQSDANSLEQALVFIDEGVRNNPKSFQLELMRGRILLAKDKVAEAIAAFRRSAQLALAVRPQGGAENATWTYWEEEDFSAAVHYVPALTWMRLHDAEAARRELAWAAPLVKEGGRLAQLREQIDSAGTQ